MLSAVVRDRHVYGPGATFLKDVATNYQSLTGPQKALLGSIQLLVFRQVLAFVESMVIISSRYLSLRQCSPALAVRSARLPEECSICAKDFKWISWP